MPWYYYALSAAGLFTVQELLMRVLAIKSNVPRVFSVMFNAWGTFFALIAFLIMRGSFTGLSGLTGTHIALITSACLLYGIYERYQFTARKSVDASSLSIIFRLSTVTAFVGSIVFLRETLTVSKVFGAALIIGASFLLIYKNTKIKISRNLFFPLLCAACLGSAMVVDKPASAHIQPALYSIIVWFFAMLFAAFPGIPKRQLMKEFRIGSWKVALAALLNVIGYIVYIQAFVYADASRVIPVMSIDGILIVLGGIIILGEHEHFWRKIIAGLIAFAGVYFLR